MKRPRPPDYDRRRDGNVFDWILRAADGWRAEIQLGIPSWSQRYALPPNRVTRGGERMK